MIAMSSSKSYNVWDTKPRWCQPWSILLTGIVVIGGSWFLIRTVWLTILVSLPILLWWFVFLILYPHSTRQLQAESNTIEPDRAIE
jgi:hypothetical protein